MKKFLSIFTILVFIFTLAACKPSVDPAQDKLDAAASGLDVLIGDPNSITSSFNVPTNLKDGVVAAWTSSEPGVASVGQPNAQGQVVITVNRPAKGSGDAKATLTATLTINDAKGKALEKKWTITITVKEQSVEEIKIETIRDILNIRDDAYDPSDKKEKVQVTINNASVFAEGSDSVFIYDGTGIVQVYGGASGDMKQGKVYNVTGLLEWYFGLWEIIDSTVVEVEGATPQTPEKVIVDDVLEFRNQLTAEGDYQAAFGTAKDGNFEPIYARITAKVHVIPGDTSNYNTYLLNKDFEGSFLGDEKNPAKGFMAYYYTNDFTYLKSFNGLEVELDVVLHTYRSNNYAFAFYYVGGKDGIELGTLSDADKINLDFNAITIAGSYTDAATLNLIAEGEQGTEFVWSYTDAENANNDIIDLATGKITPVEGEMRVLKITVTATNGETEVVKNYEIAVGNYNVSTMESIINGDLKKGDPYRVIGILLGNSAPTTYFITDGTGGLGVFVPNNSELQEAFKEYPVGTVLDLTGTYDLYNGLHQISGVTMNTHSVVNQLVPYKESVDISDFAAYTTESLKDLHGLKVKVEGLTLKADLPEELTTYLEFRLVNATEQEILVRLDHRVPYAADVFAYLKDFKAGDVIDIDGLVVGFFNNPQLLFVNNPFAEQPELSTIKEVNEGNLTKGDVIRIRGIFTGGTTPSAFWLQDATAGINLYVPTALRPMFAKLTPGVELEITGTYDLYNGMHEITGFSISTIKLINDEPELPEIVDVSDYEFTAEAFKDLHAMLVKVAGFTVKADGPTTNAYYDLVIVSPTGKEFTVKYDHRVGFSNDVYNYLTTLKAGDAIDIDMLVVTWNNGPFLGFVSNPFAN